MRPSWGMTEVSSGVTFSERFSLGNSSDDDAFVGVGGPIQGVGLRIVDEHHHLVEEGQIGALEVKGLTVTSGYYKDEEANQKGFTRDGWFKTGDLAYIKHGRLTITGREKDVIIVCGNNYYCQDIEATAEMVKGVNPTYTAACAFRDKDSSTDKLLVFFNPLPKYDLHKISKEIYDNIVTSIGIPPDYLIPISVEDVFKTTIGKIQKNQLVTKFKAGKLTSMILK